MMQAVRNMSVADYEHMDTCPLGGDNLLPELKKS